MILGAPVPVGSWAGRHNKRKALGVPGCWAEAYTRAARSWGVRTPVAGATVGIVKSATIVLYRPP